MPENFLTIVGPMIGLLGVIYAARMTYQSKREEREQAQSGESTRSTVEQSRILQANLLARLTELETEIKGLKAQNEELKDRFDTLKGGLFTMSLMGNDAPFAMWVKDRGGKRIYHNEAYEDMTGFRLASCVGLSDYDIIYKYTKGSKECRTKVAKEISDDWEKQDSAVINTGQSLMTLERACHSKSPEDMFLVLVTKWASKVGDKVVGVQGKAIKFDVIQAAIRESQLGVME